MRVRLLALPFVALAAGSIDAVLVRRAQSHRPADLELFLQSVAIWLVLGLLAYLPARFLGALLGRLGRVDRGRADAGEDPGDPGDPREAASGSAQEGSWAAGPMLLALVTVLPVAAHMSLSRHIQSAGDLSALRAVQPWVELALTVAGAAVVAFVFTKLFGKLPAFAVVVFIVALSAAVGIPRPASAKEELPATAFEEDLAPAGADAPNLLLLVWDTTRAKSLAPYGYGRETTPYLSELAERALVFEEARSVSSFTYTSHLSMLTGVYPSHHGGRLTRMTYDPDETPSIARLLKGAGYRTGAFVGTGVLRASTGIVDGFEAFDDRVDPAVCDTQAWKLVHDVQALLAKLNPAFRGNGNPHWIETFQRPASEVLAKAADWIESDDPRPWFCMINLYDVHWPYLPRGAGREKFVRPYEGPADGYLFRSDNYHLPQGGKKGAKFTAVDDRHLTDLYDAEMYDLDVEVSAFLKRIEGRGGRDTALLLTSDHGEAFGEADAYGHHGVLESQVRVPLLLVQPGVAPGRAEERASGVDVAVTMLAAAGLEVPGHMTGQDLAQLREPDRVVLVEHRDTPVPAQAQYSVYQGSWKLTRHGDADSTRFELYDLSSDPEGLENVAPAHPERVAEMATLLTETQAGWGGAREVWKAPAEGPRDHLKALGYGGGDDE